MKRGTAKLRAALRARSFVRAYLTGPDGVRGNAAQSARVAGSRAAPGLSLAVRGTEYLNRPEVRRLLARHLEREEVTTQRLLHELASVALANLSDVIEWDERGARLVTSSKVLDDDTLAAVQEVEQVPTEHGTRVRVRLHDKVQAIKVLLQAKRVVGDDVPREFTLIIGRAGPVHVDAGGDGASPLTLRLGAAPASTNGDEAPLPPDATSPEAEDADDA